MQQQVPEKAKGQFGIAYEKIHTMVSDNILLKDSNRNQSFALIRNFEDCDDKGARSALLVLCADNIVTFVDEKGQDRTAEAIASVIGPSLSILGFSKETPVNVGVLRGPAEMEASLQAGAALYASHRKQIPSVLSD